MPNKKDEPEFKVSDRRRFSAEGTVVGEEAQEREEEQPAPRPSPLTEATPQGKRGPELIRDPPSPVPRSTPTTQPEGPPPPTAEQRIESSRAYKESTDEMDAQLRRDLGGQAVPDDFKAGFDRVVEPLYVTALVQLGFMGQEGQTQRRVDIIGARQSIDALTLLQEKTKGNLTPTETAVLEDVLYDIRMKYLEVTNALARAVKNPSEGQPSGGGKA
jgi:hypothetical protein